MKAAVFEQYGSPEEIHVQEWQSPAPADHEVLIKVAASSVTMADTMMRRGDPYIARLATGIPHPKHKVLGTGFAGEVVEVGSLVSEFNAGDRVFGETGLGFSANADLACVSHEGVILHLPDFLTFEEAAPLGDGALTAFNFLRSVTELKAGQNVLINGASGSIGSAAVQIAKYIGARVTAVCSKKNHGLVLSLGADEVVDYGTQDFTENLDCYDVVFDTVGKRSFSECKKALKKHGEYISPVLTFPLLFNMVSTKCFGNKKAKFSATGLKSPDELKVYMREILNLMEAGKLKTVLDKQYELNRIADAHEYVERGHKVGSVVVVHK